MAFRVSIGQYLAGNSVIHKLDPRTKILAAFVLMVSAFFIQAPMQLVFGLVCVTTLSRMAHVPAGKLFDAIKSIVGMLLALGLINMLMIHRGEVLVSWGILNITNEGVRVALLYSLRMIVAIVAATLLLLTTTPTQLTDAFDALLSPLSKLGLPAHELAMVFSLMLRFIPTLADEANAIMDAQMVRGAGINEGSVLKRIQAIVPVITALLASALRHANGLARSLDARSYEGGAARSHWHRLVYKKRDALAGALTLLYCIMLGLLAGF
ncbi:energy-coupling factor transporter transmembrane component T family protein [Atopobium fossor]|uniref:energy-coupling factor transporter transmembrane component T family protein n=1 Tax=Atopobium fossor TaxID=39487 RepID=UPI00040AA780|nr:energy-coupling factor transporter transmembrane component T [Atopobium fossor]